MKSQILINLFLCLFLLFFDKDKFLESMWVFYVIHYTALFVYVYITLRKNCFNVLMIFSPIIFSFIYLGISFTLGSIFLPLQYGWFTDIIENFVIIKKLNIYTIYIFLVDVFLLWLWSSLVIKKAHKIPEKNQLKWIPFNQTLFSLSLILFLSINLIPFFNVITFGFSYSFKLVLIIYLVIQGFSFSNRLRFLLYFVIIAIIVPFHYESKREIILVFFIILFLEMLKNKYKIKLNLKYILLGLTGILLGVYLVLAASIMRGYGGYELENKFDAFLYVPNYVNQPYFKHAFVDNFELTAVLGNSMICMDLIENGKIPIQFGRTYLKILLSPIPRSLWSNKPHGMVLLYSYTYNPDFEEIGQNYPVVHHVEGFANFYWLGVLLTPLIMYFFERLYWYIMTRKRLDLLNGKLIFSIYAVCTVFQYVRGIGFDTYLLYCLVPVPLIIFFSFIPVKKRN